MIKRVILIILDSLGIGALPDADKYGDVGSNTLGNIARSINASFSLPNLENLGLGNISDGLNIESSDSPTACFGSAMEQSPGKDTTTGHWEIAGIVLQHPFPTFTNGFPPEIIELFENKIGTKTLANIPASGTVIIEDFGEQHINTGYPIVYTSADSVFQIAAHEAIISVKRLYEICQTARVILKDGYAVGRVIARPFIGKKGSFQRTTNRKDFSLKPFGKTVLNHIAESGKQVMAVGKIEDIFAGYGVTDAVHTENNMDGVNKTLDYMKTNSSGLIFTNLVDFDSLYGHRNNVEGYANALMEFDKRVPDILQSLKDDDVLMIAADHGNDPTIKESTDHTREYIPILIYGKNIKEGVNIGTRKSFADIGATITEMLAVKSTNRGESFHKTILKA